MKLIAVVIVILGCTSVHWPRGSSYTPNLIGSQTVASDAWEQAISYAVALWAPAFDVNCPFPFTLDYTNSVAGRKFISLVTSAEWDKPGYNGWTSHDSIRILGDTVTDKRAVIAHEFGHAMGLKHNTRLTSIMYPTMASIKIPDAQDFIDVRASVGCP